MNTVTVTLGTLVDRALEELRSQYEVGRPVVRSDSLTPSTTQFTLNVANVNIGDVLEFAAELMLCTAKTTGTTPTYTVIRGWDNTQATSHDANEAGFVNPTFSRKAAAAGVKRSLSCIQSTAGLEFLKTEDYVAVADPYDTSVGITVIELPEETLDVWYVRSGIANVRRWRFMGNVATTTYDTGKILVLPLGWDTTTTVAVTRLVPYRWSSYPDDPDEEDEIELPEGTDYLPSTYATAWVISGREVSRTEIDRSEEWNRSEPARGGVSQSVVRDKWQQFYRKLDECRRIDAPMPTRPYVPMAW